MKNALLKRSCVRAALFAATAVASVLLLQCSPFTLLDIIDGPSRSSLAISPSTLVIPVNQVVTFTASGGVPPYNFNVASGVGQITDPAAGTYDALGVPGSAVIRVTDKTGKTQDARITVMSSVVAVGISPSSVTVKINTTLTFSGFGGGTPYVFSKVSGGGSIDPDTGVYAAPPVAGLAKVQITDAGGTTKIADITIDDTGLTLALSPSTIKLLANSSMTFTAVGGVPSYSYSIQTPGSGSPAINANTGVYVAGASPGFDTVVVRDSASPQGISTATVEVVALSSNVDYDVPGTAMIGSATVGAQNVPGGSFTLHNRGTGNGGTTVFYKVYLSTNNSLDGGDMIVGSGTATALDATVSASVNPTLSFPVVPAGSYYLIAEVEASDDPVTNNNLSAASPITLNPQDIDYSVPGVSHQTGTFAGQAVTGAFTVHNGGAATGLASVNWKAYASADGTLDAGDYLLAAGTTSGLGASATSGTITFSGIWPTTPGSYSLIVSVCADDEHPAKTTNNWTASNAVNVSGAPPANVDYVVAGVSAPSASAAGKPFTATFTYKNQGSASGSQDVRWTAYLSSDNTLQLGTDTVIDSGTVTGGALVGGATSSPVSFGGAWPGVSGQYYLIVAVYAPDDIVGTNNWKAGFGVTTTPPNINYWVPFVSNSTGTVAGDSFSGETAVVQNMGSDPGASNAYWTAYLSLDSSLDATDEMLDSGAISGGLANGATSSITFKGRRPATVGTAYWLIVKVDASDEPAANAGNNWTASPSATTTAPAVNYTPNAPGGISATTAGKAFSGTFTITNTGSHDGTQAVPWRIYMSSDAVWDAGDQLVDSGVIASPGLGKGATSSALTFSGTWPGSLFDKTYYLIAKTYAGDDQNSTDNERYAGPLTVKPPDVNYSVTNPTAPATALTSTALNQSFSFQKSGADTGAAAVSYEVYASPGNTILGDAGDILITSGSLGVAPPTQTVNYAGSWPSAPGSYYLIVRITAADDTNPSDNIAFSSIAVVVSASPLPDYSITSVPMPTGNQTGMPVTGTFTIKNNSVTAGATPVYWYVYASLGNNTYDAGDTVLASGSSPLLAGGATWSPPGGYTGTWPQTTGDYYIVVHCQNDQDTTITDLASAKVVVSNPPPPDYTITTVPAAVLPATGTPTTLLSAAAGGPYKFSITNTSANPGNQLVYWRVYASRDVILDGSDLLIASGSIPPLGGSAVSSDITFDGNWPAMGAYYKLIFMVDAADDSNPPNNTWVSGPIEVPNTIAETEPNNSFGPTTVPLTSVTDTTTILPGMGMPAQVQLDQLLKMTGTTDPSKNAFDTFKVDVAAGATQLMTNVYWNSGANDINLYIWDETGLQGPSVLTTPNQEVVTWIIPHAGIWYVGVEVLSNGVVIPYSLYVLPTP